MVKCAVTGADCLILRCSVYSCCLRRGLSGPRTHGSESDVDIQKDIDPYEQMCIKHLGDQTQISLDSRYFTHIIR